MIISHSIKHHLTIIAKELGVKRQLLASTLYSRTSNRARFYVEKEIPKRNGDLRKIHAVKGSLWFLQKRAYEYLSAKYTPHAAAKGFVKGTSIVSHAKIHKRKKIILSYDIKDFFPSITFARVTGMFQKYPFNFPKEKAVVLSQICCLPDNNGSLPQGGITSPYISNMICRRLDARLLNFSSSKNMDYSRYADDLTFSTNENINPDKINKFVSTILSEEGFEINESKTRLMKKSDRQVVTGIVLNEGLNVNRKYIKSLRAVIHNSFKRGIYHEATKRRVYRDKEKKYSWDRIYCLPYEFDENGYVYRTDGRKFKYKDPATGEVLNSSKQVLELFRRHIEGRLEFVRHVADSNTDKQIREKRLSIYSKLKDDWEKAKQFDTDLKRLYKPYPGYEKYQQYRSAVNQSKDIDELKLIIEQLKNKENDIRFFLKFPSDILKIKKTLMDRLRFPPLDISTIIHLGDDLRSSEKGELGRMVHRNLGVVNRSAIEEYYSNFNANYKYSLNYNMKITISSFFENYLRYLDDNNLNELIPHEHKKLWDEIIVKFKDTTRFYTSEESQESKNLDKSIIEIFEYPYIRKIYETKKISIDLTNILPDKPNFSDIFTDVGSVLEALRALVESMVKNTPLGGEISIDRSIQTNAIKIDYSCFEAFVIKNDDTKEYKKEIWKNRECFRGKSTKVLKKLNGLVLWYISFNTAQGRTIYDVYNNTFTDISSDGEGFSHTLIFPGLD